MSRSHSQHKSDLLITNEDATSIGGRIRRIRGAASQREFAGRLGISREHLSRIESGAQVPGTETLRRLAQMTRVSLDFVLLDRASAPARVVADADDWQTTLGALLEGTRLRLAPPSRTTRRAWQALSDEGKDAIRAVVRRFALAAVAIEALLPARTSKALTSELSAELSAVVVERILEGR